MEVDIIINDQLNKDAGIIEELLENDNCGKRKPLSTDKTYHVFFCYRDVPDDKLWVKEVVNKLENEHGYICCDHERDFIPGTKIIDNIKSGIKSSEKVVVVLSKEALDSEYVQFEAELAHKLSIEKRENLLIPVLLGDCEIPEELRLLTYIDARKEIDKRTWWPKLIAAIESKEGSSFFKGKQKEETKLNPENKRSSVFKELCSLETTFSLKECSIQPVSKYIPWQLVSNETVVPLMTIKGIKKDLMDVPRIRCKQNCCCFVNLCISICILVGVALFVFDLVLIGTCVDIKTVSTEDCFLVIGVFFIIQISIGIGCGVGWKCYFKVPKSLDKKIIEYNTELIKDGILITVVYRQLWATVTKYVALHLREDRKVEREPLLDTSKMQAKHDADDIPLLTSSENEEPDQLTKKYETLYLREDRKTERETFVDTSEMQATQDADDDPLLTLSKDEEPAQSDKADQRNFGHRQRDVDNGSTIVDLSHEEIVHEENEPIQSSQDSNFAQISDSDGLENVALTTLLKCTHEYLRLAMTGKIKNPKQDRHAIDCMCFCQYLEKTDKKFRKIVDRNKIIHTGILSVEKGTNGNNLDAYLI